MKEEALDDLPWKDERAIVSQANTGVVPKATSGKLLRDGMERIWAFPCTQIPPWTELNWTQPSKSTNSGKWYDVRSMSQWDVRIFIYFWTKRNLGHWNKLSECLGAIRQCQLSVVSGTNDRSDECGVRRTSHFIISVPKVARERKLGGAESLKRIKGRNPWLWSPSHRMAPDLYVFSPLPAYRSVHVRRQRSETTRVRYSWSREL